MKTKIRQQPFQANRFKTFFIGLFLCVLALTILPGCSLKDKPSVVVYTSVDQVFSEAIFNRFESDTGIKVLAVYDIEASKTTGLVNRIIAEANNPQADVFWNGEFVQTLLLKEKGLLAKYQSPEAEKIPVRYRDKNGYWTAFSARARVLIVNTTLVSEEDYPSSIFDLTKPKWTSRGAAIAYPLFGTTATHAAALYTLMGKEKAKNFFESIKSSGVSIVPGNSVVRDLVASGKVAVGLTDTDDACGAIIKGAPLKMLFPDQRENEMGTLLLPGTVALIRNCRNPETGKKFIDYLLRKEAEKLLLDAGWAYYPFHSMKTTPKCFYDSQIKYMKVTPEMVYDHFNEAMNDLRKIFIQ